MPINKYAGDGYFDEAAKVVDQLNTVLRTSYPSDSMTRQLVTRLLLDLNRQLEIFLEDPIGELQPPLLSGKYNIKRRIYCKEKDETYISINQAATKLKLTVLEIIRNMEKKSPDFPYTLTVIEEFYVKDPDDKRGAWNKGRKQERLNKEKV